MILHRRLATSVLLAATLACAEPDVAPATLPPQNSRDTAPFVASSASPVDTGARVSGVGFASAAGTPLGSTAIAVVRWTDVALAELLGGGRFREPARASTTGSAPLMVRLWSVAREGACVSETHFVCQHDYVLSVLTGDLGDTPGVYFLGRVGEVTDVRWVSENVPWMLELTVSNYPPASHTASVDWRLESRTVRLGLSYDSVWVVR